MAKRILSICMAVMLCLPLFTACKGKEKTETQTNTVTDGGQVLDIFANGSTEFTVIYSVSDGTATNATVTDFVSKFKQNSGIELTVGYDKTVAAASNTKEILIGRTNRAESPALRTDDYFVGVVGSKLIIAGGSMTATSTAIDKFFESFMPESMQSLCISTDQNISHTGEYTVSSMTLGGHSVGEFEIVLPSSKGITERRAALAIRDAILYNVGFDLPIVDEALSTSEHKILIGKTKASTLTVGKNEYKLELMGDNVQLLADNYEAYNLACEWLKRQIFLAGKDGIAFDTLSRTEKSEDKSARAGEYRILINNIYGGHQPQHPFAQRGEMLAELYAMYDADVIGLQEFTDKGDSIGARIEALGYTKVDVDSGSSRNCVPLYYKADTFTLADSGFHRYDDGQGDNSKSVTWAVFKNKASGDTFAVASTHFAWKEESIAGEARLKDAEQLLAIIAQIKAEHNCPIFFGGDYNCNTYSAPYKKITDSGATDVKYGAKQTLEIGTHHAIANYNQELAVYENPVKPTNGYAMSIDHIFFNGKTDGTTLERFNIVTDLYALLSSDHCPMVLDFSLE